LRIREKFRLQKKLIHSLESDGEEWWPTRDDGSRRNRGLIAADANTLFDGISHYEQRRHRGTLAQERCRRAAACDKTAKREKRSQRCVAENITQSDELSSHREGRFLHVPLNTYMESDKIEANLYSGERTMRAH